MENENLQEVSMNEMVEALEKGIMKINSGDILLGKVISVTENEVFVNIGYMSDGVISKEELSNEEGVDPREVVKPGDEIQVCILEVNDGEGNISLSKKRVDGIKIWEDLEKLFNSGAAFEVTVSEVVKGGVLASIKGLRAFIPASQLSMSYVENLDEFVGKTILVKVIELDKEKKKIVLSKRELEKVEAEIEKGNLWDNLKKGEKRMGKVSRLATFGAFVDLGGADGLIHISQLSWKNVKDPSEILTVGDLIEVTVMDFDKEKGRISLGIKDEKLNPWNMIATNYKTGDVVEGTVVRLLDFGAFVQIESGIDGLVHISQISEDRISKPADVLKVGDKVKVKILEINEKDRKMSLSIKEALENEHGDFAQYNNNSGDATTTLADLLKGFKFEE
jgi:small subunit ribosomal protein S1